MLMQGCLLLTMHVVGNGLFLSSAEPSFELPNSVGNMELVLDAVDADRIRAGEDWFIVSDATQAAWSAASERSFMYDRRLITPNRCGTFQNYYKEAHAWRNRQLKHPWQRELRDQLLRDPHQVCSLSIFEYKSVEMKLIGLCDETVVPKVAFLREGTLLLRPLHMVDPQLRSQILSLDSRLRLSPR